MFDAAELVMILNALTDKRKSLKRLADKEGQPESVAREYGMIGVKYDALIAKGGKALVEVQGSTRSK